MSAHTKPVAGLSVEDCQFEIVDKDFPGYLHGHVQLCGLDVHVQAYRLRRHSGEAHSSVPHECRGDLEKVYDLNGGYKSSRRVAIEGHPGEWIVVAVPFA